jgi:hypothetical protein
MEIIAGVQMQIGRKPVIQRGFLNKCRGIVRQLVGPELFLGNKVRERVFWAFP